MTASVTLPGLWVAVAVLTVVAGLLAVDAPPARDACCTVHDDCQHQVTYNNVSCHVPCDCQRQVMFNKCPCSDMNNATVGVRSG